MTLYIKVQNEFPYKFTFWYKNSNKFLTQQKFDKFKRIIIKGLPNKKKHIFSKKILCTLFILKIFILFFGCAYFKKKYYKLINYYKNLRNPKNFLKFLIWNREKWIKLLKKNLVSLIYQWFGFFVIMKLS